MRTDYVKEEGVGLTGEHMKLERMDFVDGDGVTFVYRLCEQITDLVNSKENLLNKQVSSNKLPDVSTVYFEVEELSNLYSNMLSTYHEFVRKVAKGFKDISKNSEYLVALFMALRSEGFEGLRVDKKDFDILLSNSFDLYTNISNFLSRYYLLSDKYHKLISLLSEYKGSSLDENGFVESLSPLITELSTWRKDLWKYVQEIYTKARALEDSYNYAYRLISHYHPSFTSQGPQGDSD